MTDAGHKPATGLFSFLLTCQKASPFSPRAFHQMLKAGAPVEWIAIILSEADKHISERFSPSV